MAGGARTVDAAGAHDLRAADRGRQIPAGRTSRAVSEPTQVARDWLPHLVAVAVVLAWLDHVGLGLGYYVLAFVYPGMALTMLRSFAEHRAELGTAGHAATVERGGVFALLFLAIICTSRIMSGPGLPWYELPAYHREHHAG